MRALLKSFKLRCFTIRSHTSLHCLALYMLFENLHIHMFVFELEVEKEWSCYFLAYFVGNFPSLIQNCVLVFKCVLFSIKLSVKLMFKRRDRRKCPMFFKIGVLRYSHEITCVGVSFK